MTRTDEMMAVMLTIFFLMFVIGMIAEGLSNDTDEMP